MWFRERQYFPNISSLLLIWHSAGVTFISYTNRVVESCPAEELFFCLSSSSTGQKSRDLSRMTLVSVIYSTDTDFQFEDSGKFSHKFISSVGCPIAVLLLFEWSVHRALITLPVENYPLFLYFPCIPDDSLVIILDTFLDMCCIFTLKIFVLDFDWDHCWMSCSSVPCCFIFCFI